jgi:hypothetical protein
MARSILCSLLLLLAPASLAAQSLQNVLLRNSFNPVGAGARGAGMAGAFIAVADDGTAASFNPAGLAQVRRIEAAVVYFDSTLVSSLNGAQPNAAEERARHGVIDFVGVAVPFKVRNRRLTMQLAYQRAVDLYGLGNARVSTPYVHVDPPLATVPVDLAETVTLDATQSGALHVASLSGGYELGDHFLVGASVNLWLGKWTATGTETADAHLRGEGFAFDHREMVYDYEHGSSFNGQNVGLGVLWRSRRLQAGAVLRWPFSGAYHLDEQNTETDYDYDEQAQPPQNVDTRVRSRLRWPRSAGVGLAFRPFSRLTLAADVVISEWSQAVIENLPNGALLTPQTTDSQGAPLQDHYVDRNFFDLFPASRSFTADSGEMRLGAEYLLTLPRFVLPLRAGLFRERSPVLDLGAEKARLVRGFSFGFGINTNRFVWDLAYQWRSSEGAVDVVMTPDYTQVLETKARERAWYGKVITSLIVRLGKSR